MRMFDLFSGEGGAGKGYADAGFEVIGVDNKPQPRYPFRFIQADALEFLRTHIEVYDFDGIDLIHASPPCQRYSVTRNFTGKGDTWPDLVGPVRELLIRTGLPYVIENVPGAPLIDPVILCGSHFNLAVEWDDRKVGLRRHRLFETSFPVSLPGPCDHSLSAITVAGHDVPSHQRKFGQSVPLWVRKQLMGIDWMGRDALGQAIPPAYTKYIGEAFLASMQQSQDEEAA